MSGTTEIRQITKEELLQTDLSRWMAWVDEVKKEGILALEQCRVHLEELDAAEDIRYKYFRKEYVNKFVLLESESESYEKLVQRFHDFTVATLEYYLELFQDSAFEGEMEMLPKEARGAVALNNMFARDEADWEGKLADLRECARYYPALGKNIKRLAHLIGEQIEQEKAAQAEAVNDELSQMIRVMKDKLRSMAEQGLREEALQVLAQVRKLAPKDRELQRMEEELTGSLENREILLSISILCSGRSKTTRKCLESLEKLREKVSCELIIVDTGCKDTMRSLLSNYADVITEFTWCNDFSKARNAGLKLARGEWFLYLDDDEWFSDSDAIIRFFASGEYKQYNSAVYIQRNYLDMQGSQYTDSWVARMIKLGADTRFEGRIHEYLTPISGKKAILHGVAEHYGYVYETQEALMAHYERNSTLLKEMIKEQPLELRWYMLLAQEYRTACRWEELYKLGEEGIALINLTNSEESLALGTFYGAQIWALKEQGKQGMEICQKALGDSRNMELTKAFCQLHMCWFAYWLGRYEEAIQHGQKYLEWKDYFKDKEELLVFQRTAPFVADSFDMVMIKQTYSIMICGDLRLGRIGMLEQHLDKLGWEESHIYVFEDMIPTLAEVMERIQDTPAGQKLLAVMQAHKALWEYYRKTQRIEENG